MGGERYLARRCNANPAPRRHHRRLPEQVQVPTIRDRPGRPPTIVPTLIPDIASHPSTHLLVGLATAPNQQSAGLLHLLRRGVPCRVTPLSQSASAEAESVATTAPADTAPAYGHLGDFGWHRTKNRNRRKRREPTQLCSIAEQSSREPVSELALWVVLLYEVKEAYEFVTMQPRHVFLAKTFAVFP